MPHEKTTGIQSLLLRTFLPIVVVVAILLAAIVYNALYAITLKGFDDRLIAASALTGALIDPADHDRLIRAATDSKNDAEKVEREPPYRRNVEPMQRIRDQLGLTYIYTQIAGGPEDVLYVLDGTQGDDHTLIGSPDSLPAETVAGLRRVQQSGSIHISPVEYQEQWGLLKTAAAPIYGADGRITGTAGADVNVSVIQIATQNALFQSAMIGLASILACLFVTLQIVRRVARPIERLTQDALGIAAGDHSPPTAIRSPREARALRDALDRLNGHVANAHYDAMIAADRHRLAESERLLRDEVGDAGGVVILADSPARRLIWIAADGPDLTSALATRAMLRLRDRLAAQLHLLDHVEALADLDHGACLSFDPAIRLLRLTGNSPLTVEANGNAISLAPDEAATIPAGVARLRHDDVTIELGSEAPP